MREIKFRAFQDGEMVTQPIMGNYAAARFFGFIYEDAPVMQYTGLKDKNGKEIYEGDILSYGKFALNDTDKYGIRCWESLPDGVDPNSISTVMDTFSIEFTPTDLMTLQSVIENNPDVVGVEVIGNIYENGDLLDD